MRETLREALTELVPRWVQMREAYSKGGLLTFCEVLTSWPQGHLTSWPHGHAFDNRACC